MFARFRRFLETHPSLRTAIRWSVPALLVGALLRLLLLSYLPYAYWGSDSRSYYSFANMLLGEGYVSLDEKRRFLYPILMVPVSLLPGLPPLQWLALAQHAFGLATIVPLAYVARRSFVTWKAWIVPITLIYAGTPMFIWYEHELLGETVFFGLLVWAFAGWCAWINETRPERARRLFWLFFIPLALFLLTKPSGRFVWPGIAVGLLATGAWRRLDWRRWASLAALVAATLAVGSSKQGAWLLYVASFPLTQLDTPKHAELKAEARPLVEPLRRDAEAYYALDDLPFDFLEKPSRHPGFPQWHALHKDPRKKAAVYLELAKEGILAEPLLFLYFGAQRVVASANQSNFKLSRFESARVVERSLNDYREAERKPGHALRRLLALPREGALPPADDFARRIAPRPGSWMERAFLDYATAFQSAADLVRIEERGTPAERSIRHARPTFLGGWLLVAMALSVAMHSYRPVLGVWAVIAVGYLFGVFLFSQLNPRYFGPALPIFIVLLGVPVDALVSAFRRRRAHAPST